MNDFCDLSVRTSRSNKISKFDERHKMTTFINNKGYRYNILIRVIEKNIWFVKEKENEKRNEANIWRRGKYLVSKEREKKENVCKVCVHQIIKNRHLHPANLGEPLEE